MSMYVVVIVQKQQTATKKQYFSFSNMKQFTPTKDNISFDIFKCYNIAFTKYTFKSIFNIQQHTTTI